MKNFLLSLNKSLLVAAGALTLGACSRGEYAMLPKSPAYLGTKNASVAVRPTTATPETAPVAAATPAPVAAPAVAAPKPLGQPAAKAAPVAAAASQASAVVASAQPTAPQKLNLVQRLALNKISKKLNKVAAKSSQFKQGDNTAHASRIDGNLRTGIIILLIGLIVGLFNGLIGTIIALIGLIFIVLWLLDSL